ncbi:MAG: DUF5050 domain-containing protein [Firmicutes bacterium]|nr:DUF5050 domain-containing protein [Bacillota bacterium]
MKFKKLAVLCSLLVCSFFVFAACQDLPTLKDGPAAGAPVYGNGGMSVVKGDYLYFVNGYTSYSSIAVGENDGKAEYPVLYRVKLGSDGRVVVKVEYDDDGEVIFDRAQTIKNADIISRKIVGFEHMGIYIFGDYIYYASPNNQRTGNQQLRSDLIDFWRSKLDRSSNPERLYTTSAPGTSVQYTMQENGNKVYLQIVDGTKISLVTINANGRMDGKPKTLAEDVQAAVLPKIENYSSAGGIATPDTATLSFNKNIYYTRAVTEDDNVAIVRGNVLCRVNIESSAKTELFTDGNSISLMGIEGAGIFYTRNSRLYFNDVSGGSSNFFSGERELTTRSLSTAVYVNNILGKGVVGSDGNNLWYIVNNTEQLLLNESISQILRLQGNWLYYLNGGAVMRVNIASSAVEEVVGAHENALLNGVSYVGFDHTWLYYMKRYTNENGESYYMHRVDVTIKQGDGTFYSEFVGVMREQDWLPEQE